MCWYPLFFFFLSLLLLLSTSGCHAVSTSQRWQLLWHSESEGWQRGQQRPHGRGQMLWKRHGLTHRHQDLWGLHHKVGAAGWSSDPPLDLRNNSSSSHLGDGHHIKHGWDWADLHSNGAGNILLYVTFCKYLFLGLTSWMFQQLQVWTPQIQTTSRQPLPRLFKHGSSVRATFLPCFCWCPWNMLLMHRD